MLRNSRLFLYTLISLKAFDSISIDRVILKVIYRTISGEIGDLWS